MALNNLANNLNDQSDLAGAKKMYEETLAAYRQIGNKRGAAGALDNIANLLGDLGDPAGARKLSEDALNTYREIGDHTGMGEPLNNIAAEQVIAGDFEGATKTFQQALDIWRRPATSTSRPTRFSAWDRCWLAKETSPSRANGTRRRWPFARKSVKKPPRQKAFWLSPSWLWKKVIPPMPKRLSAKL